MSTPRVYRLIDNNKVVGEFTQVEIIRMIGITRHTLINYSDVGLTYQKRYRFERIENDPSESSRKEKLQVLMEWDEVRFKLNPKAKRSASYGSKKRQLENH